MGPLDGVRVLDFSIWRPGPYATQLLAEMGADVLKVEPPGGDPMRAYPGIFEALNAGKRSMVLDLKADEARATALGLAAGADVVVESYRPGVAERLGVGAADIEAVNPGVVYCSVSGMGQGGPLALVPGHDVNYLAWSGALAPEGGEPRLPAIPVADLSGGMGAAMGICAALAGRGLTGEGERIDVSIGDVLATWTGAVPPVAEGVREGGRGVPGYGVFETGDSGWLALGVLTEDHFWAGLCGVLGLDDVEALSFVERMAEAEALRERIASAIASRERAALVEALSAADVPAAPVLDRRGMLDLAHFRDRGLVGSGAGGGAVLGHAVRHERHPTAHLGPAPGLDEHAGEGFAPEPGGG